MKREYIIFWLGVLATLVVTSLEFFHEHALNYVDYRDATLNFFNGISSYTTEYVRAHSGWYYLYSPVFHYLFAPFAFLPFYVGGYLWNLVGWIAFFFAVYLLPGQLSKHIVPLLLYTVLIVMQGIFAFQYNVLIGCFFLWAYVLLERDCPFWAVALIMLSATTKIYGLIELALLLCYPKFWRNMGYAVLIGCGLLLIPMFQLGWNQFVPWYMDWFHALTDHCENTCSYLSVVWAQPTRAWLLPNMRIVQLVVLAALSVMFFVCHKAWTEEYFKVGVLSVLMMYIVLFSEAAEPNTHLISVVGFAMWFYSAENRNRFIKIGYWCLFAFFCVMPIDVLFPASWFEVIQYHWWVGVWIYTVLFFYVAWDVISRYRDSWSFRFPVGRTKE